jgi:hypothetical protein
MRRRDGLIRSPLPGIDMPSYLTKRPRKTIDFSPAGRAMRGAGLPGVLPTARPVVQARRKYGGYGDVLTRCGSSRHGLGQYGVQGCEDTTGRCTAQGAVGYALLCGKIA